MTCVTATVAECPACGKKNRVPAAADGTPRCGQCRAPVPWIVEAGEDNFAEVAESPPVPVLLDLWAPWCGPCRMVSPALESLARRYAGKVKLVKVDVDQHPGISRRFGVHGIPTLLVLDRGKVVERQTGAAPEHVLERWLQRALSAIG